MLLTLFFIQNPPAYEHKDTLFQKKKPRILKSYGIFLQIFKNMCYLHQTYIVYNTNFIIYTHLYYF